MFPIRPQVQINPAGMIKYFLENWKVLTKDPEVLRIVEGFSIPFVQIKNPPPCKTSKKEVYLVNLEVEEMMQKGAIQRVSECQDQFLSSIFLVKKKDSGYRPVKVSESTHSLLSL